MPIPLGLVGVGDGECRDRLVELVAVAELGGDRHRIAGAGVSARQGAAAERGIKRQRRLEPGTDIGEPRIL